MFPIDLLIFPTGTSNERLDDDDDDDE